MKNNKIEDERVIEQQRKIGSDALRLMYITYQWNVSTWRN